jgi:hypothetical protein
MTANPGARIAPALVRRDGGWVHGQQDAGLGQFANAGIRCAT